MTTKTAKHKTGSNHRGDKTRTATKNYDAGTVNKRIAAYAKAKEISESEATLKLVVYALNRMDALSRYVRKQA